MKSCTSLPRVFVSGEQVEPGIYRDIDSGATVVMLEADELPANIRIVRALRRFARIDTDCTGDEDLCLPPLLAEATT